MLKADPPISDKQRKRINAMCGDLARQIVLTDSGHYLHRKQAKGYALHKDDWRHMFVGTVLRWRFVPAVDGAGMIALAQSSLKLTESSASEVIELLFAFGAQREVVWSDPKLKHEHEQVSHGA